MLHKKILLGACAGLLLCSPRDAVASRIWDKNSEPTTSYDRTTKMVYGGLAGILAGAALGGIATQGVRGTAGVGFIGLLAGAFLGKWSADRNAPLVWFKHFSESMSELSQSIFLASGDAWSSGYDMMSEDVERLQDDLRSFLQKISRLNLIAKILLRGDAWSESHRNELSSWAQKLVVWHELCSKRLTSVSVIVDARNFSTSFESVVNSTVLKTGVDSDAWMLDATGRKQSYEWLNVHLNKAAESLYHARSASQRLLSSEYNAYMTDRDREDIVQKLQILQEHQRVQAVRAGFVGARIELENFSTLFLEISALAELDVRERSGDVWLLKSFTRSGARFDLKHLAKRLKSVQERLIEARAQAVRLMEASVIRYLSDAEQAIVASKLVALDDFIALCGKRQQMVRGLQKIEPFNEKYFAAMRPSVVQGGDGGANDLRWMEMPRETQWPLQELHKNLEASRKDLIDLCAMAEPLMQDNDVNALSAGPKDAFVSKVTALQKAHDLVGMRLLFLCNSTGYAQEVQAKIAHEDRQRELARQERELRQREAEQRVREQQERARLERERHELIRQQEATRREEARLERDRQRLELERIRNQQPLPSAPPFEVSVVNPAPSAPPADSVPSVLQQEREPRERNRQQRQQERDMAAAQRAQEREAKKKQKPAPVVKLSGKTCFCGDEIPMDKLYKLACVCKDSFYHRDCIKKWVKDSKTCPTCRSKVTIIDIQRVAKLPSEKPQPSVAKPSVAVTPAAVVVAPAAVAVLPQATQTLQSPAVAQAQLEAEECYLCMDPDNLAAYTTGNCNCTVKKAACRACLQDWLDRNHTCPNCRAEGATLVPFSR